MHADEVRAAARGARRGATLTQHHSARKLTTVYQDNRREYVAHLGLELYQSSGGAAAAARGTESEEESEDEDAFQAPAPHTHAAAPAALQQQLALVPVPNQVASPAAAARGARVPMSHLLSLVPPRRQRAGTCPATSCSTHLTCSCR